MGIFLFFIFFWGGGGGGFQIFIWECLIVLIFLLGKQ